MRTKLLIFDMDGLLLDTETVSFKAYMKAGKICQIPLEENHFYQVLGRNRKSEREFLECAIADFDWEIFQAAVQAEKNAILERDGVNVKEGALAILNWAVEREIPCVVATSTSRKKAEEHLEKAGILSYFSHLVCGDEIEHSKPAPDIFLKALAHFPDLAKEDCVILEDSHQGIEAANRAEIPVIMVPDLLDAPEGRNLLSLCQNLAEVIPFLEGRD